MSENDGRPVQTGRVSLETVPCPRCGGTESAMRHRSRDFIYGVPGEFFAASCSACGLWFQNPRPVPAQLADLYPATYAPHQSPSPAPSTETSGLARLAARSKEAVRRHAWRLIQFKRSWARGYLVQCLGYHELGDTTRIGRIAERLGAVLSPSQRRQARVDLVPRFVAGGRVLEIGSANGQRLVQLRELGWRHLHGVEMSAAAAAPSIESGFNVTVGTIEDALAQFPDNYFDVIVSAMVIEHLWNPFETMRSITAKLKPGGELLFSTVVRDSLDGWIFGKYGVSYDFPRHMVFFRKSDLLGMMKGGFERVECVHQCTPIDFVRPARFRGKWFDRHIASFFQLPGSRFLVEALARMGLMGRVSIRGHKKSIQ